MHGTLQYHTWLQFVNLRMLILVVKPLQAFGLASYFFTNVFNFLNLLWVSLSALTHGIAQYHTWLQFPIYSNSYQMQTNSHFRAFFTNSIHEFLSSTLIWIMQPNMVLQCTILGFKPQSWKFIANASEMQFEIFFSSIFMNLSTLHFYIDLHTDMKLHCNILSFKPQSP